MAWETPVFDRTAADVAAGADKCYISAALLNRIEGNTQYLADLFKVKITTKTWKNTDFLTPSQMQRILDNVSAVEKAYFALPGSPSVPSMPATHWQDINAIEQIQWGIRELLERNQSSRFYTGEIGTGEQIGVI